VSDSCFRIEHMFETCAQPGSAVAAALEDVDFATIGDEELRHAMVAAEQLSSWAQAVGARAVAEIARRTTAELGGGVSNPLVDPMRFVADEIAVELSVSKVAGSHRLAFALDLEVHSATAKAFALGRLDRGKAEEICAALNLIESDEFLPALETAAIEYGATHTRPQLKAWLRRRLIATEPEHVEQRHQQALRERKVRLFPGDDGMATLSADLAAEDALAIYRRIDQLATQSRAEERLLERAASDHDLPSMDARRADAFTDVLLGSTATAPDAEEPVVPPAVTEAHVIVTAETLAGVSQEPAELAGYGPITAEHARRLCDKDSRWRRLLTDASGSLLEVAPQTYRPTQSVSRFVETRDLVCRFPGCRRSAVARSTPGLRATGVELDHTVPFPAGETVPENLAALCKSHHLLKTHGNWRVEQDKAGVLCWTSPSGRRFHTHPHQYRNT